MGRFEATSQMALPIQHIYNENGSNGLDWQFCLDGSSNTAPRTFRCKCDFMASLHKKNLQWHLWMVSYTLHFIKRNSRVVLFLDSFVTFFSFHGFCTLTSNEPIACTRSKSIFKSCLLKQKKCHFWALVLKLWATSFSFELFMQSNHSPKKFVGKFNVD